VHPQQPQPWYPAQPAPARRDVRWLSGIGLAVGLFGLVLGFAGWSGFGTLFAALGVVVSAVAVGVDQRGRALAAVGLTVSVLVFLAVGLGMIG